VAAFFLDNVTNHFQNTRCFGICRDDGIAIFEGDLKKSDIIDWLDEFQHSVNELAENDFLCFTASIWGSNKEDGASSKIVSVATKNTFPHLDMEMSWSEEGDLRFGVHLKPNQALKCLNNGSSHPTSCIRAISQGAIGRLAKLTSCTEDSKTKQSANSAPAMLWPLPRPTSDQLRTRLWGKCWRSNSAGWKKEKRRKWEQMK